MQPRHLALALLVALPIPAHAEEEPPHEAWHFTSDTTRHARVDDRGGLGEGFSFSIDYDPNDGNSEDFCPHCRFTLFTSDPGLDLADLESLGIQRSDLSSAAGMLATLQGLAAKDPTGLAKELAPELSDQDISLYAVEITAVLDRVIDLVAVLEALAKIPTGALDLSTDEGVYAAIDALHLKQDSAFMADFSNPNDPREHNSGVAVFSLANLLGALAGKGVPDSVRNALESSIAGIPGMTGGPEISGDDDDATQPASYHGYYTDLSVKQRTYAVNGASAYLMTFQVSNDTTRIIPFVEASFMADFDIPPLGYDTSSEFDGANQALLIYDTIPYTDPEEHFWFGVAPAMVAGAPTPGNFSFLNYNLDKNFTLVISSQPHQMKRWRFFLGDPDIVGDHDDAIGKSEKTGGLSFVLDGPLFPGQSASIAFCYAAGKGNSSGAAKALYTTTMTACKALYTAFNPSCGDGVPGYGEDCEPALSEPGTCTPTCQTIECGDGRVTGDEQCDDGNVDDGDGCSMDCVSEVCGNDIVQVGEECDDGNADNSDGCLTTCTLATCGDGAVRACEGLGCGPCGNHTYCWTGSFRVTDLSSAVNTFALLYAETVPFTIGFDASSVTTANANGVKTLKVGTQGADFTFDSDISIAQKLDEALDGSNLDITLLTSGTTVAQLTIEGIHGVVDGQAVDVSISGRNPPIVNPHLDAQGNPQLADLALANANFGLGTPSDSASGVISGTIAQSEPGAGGEACDDGNTSDYDGCTGACQLAVCGDGFVQPDNGEECDSDTVWCVDCKLASLELCGNNAIDAEVGETCDDHNTIDNDGCSSLCRIESCGDGVVQTSEECDDGKNGNDDGCTDECKRETCGDDVVQSNEQCDDGDANGDTAACTSACVPAACGDGHVHASVEECDDGNTESLDGCSADCKSEHCGDGLPGPNEECDDANANDGDGCSVECHLEFCGDGLPGPGEQCDDKNTLDGDGCAKDCQLENPAACGNGKLDVGEQCDDGGKMDNDGCDSFCQLENPAACGDGTLDPGEACDDANAVDGDGCTSLCAIERCGDGFHQQGEGCDDGNVEPGDGCSAECAIEPAECGNAIQEYGEQCDDGNDGTGDGCTPGCVFEGKAPLGDTCGNATLDAGEQCDDGGRMDGNGCDATCQLEASVCGNGRLERGEVCDDQNDDPSDGCDACALTTPPEEPKGDGCRQCSGGGTPSLDTLVLALAFVFLASRPRRRAR